VSRRNSTRPREDSSLFGHYGSVNLLCGLTLPKPDGASLCIPSGDIFFFEGSVGLNDSSDASGPSRLVARANTRAGIAVEVLKEEDVVTPVRICLELLTISAYATAARLSPLPQ
jgi:hypothetical protein